MIWLRDTLRSKVMREDKSEMQEEASLSESKTKSGEGFKHIEKKGFEMCR